ncbi:LamG-like jellyroll fold domain-containing protein [Microbacterium sp. RU33B]|uniref:LamG-like jellyroll fold domain-containing protein n=1 Tax=Microbacterium sp. RU33B TaxID=1907390 RepID=UPI0009684261|nr:LamG-like jellyroll fold domain-containing protein [Microbacterium sp. RU33B]SIT68204.1 Signal peptidase I [Microbacterium sp. RU33B]
MTTKTRWRWAAVAAALALTVVVVVVFFTSGYRPFVIMTPSMATALPVGSLIVVQVQDHYSIGQIVTFLVDGRTFTHRIVESAAGGFTTRGDLNGAVDGWNLRPENIIGSVVWSARGLGWIAISLPWLVMGAIAVELIARARITRAQWRWSVRLVGAALVVTGVGLWLRPWFNVELVGWRPADTGGGVLMHVVNTGVFPVDAKGAHLASGEHATVHVTQSNAAGIHLLTPSPDLPLTGQVAIVALCLVPLVIALLGRPRDIPAADDVVDTQGSPDRRQSPGVRGVMLGGIAGATVLGVILIAVMGSGASFAASIRNTSDTAGTATYFTCRAAETAHATANTYAAYAMGTSGSSSEPDLSGNSRTGTWANSPVSSASFGCDRDLPAASSTFNGTSQCLFVPGAVASPNTFTLEAWFRTSTAGNGKIIGFGDLANTANDGANDRHIYMDPAGRLVFGVYPGGVARIISSPAGTSYADGQWHHVVASLSTAGMALYVDGVVRATNPAVTTGEVNTTGYWKVGCGKLLGWASASGGAWTQPYYFTGQIQYAAIYRIALTPTDVLNHFRAGN